MQTNFLSLFPLRHRNKVMLIVVSLVVFTLVYDTSINRLYHFNIYQPGSGDKVIAFIIILIIFIIAQFFVLEFARHQNRNDSTRHRLYLNLLDNAVPIVQFLLIGIILLVTLQIIFNASYNIDTLIASTSISYSTALVMMTLLAQRFFSWYKSNRNIVVLLYGISSAMISFNMIFGIISVALALQAQPDIMVDRIGFPAPFFTPSPYVPYINYSYFASTILSFVLTWAATSFLLRYRFRTLNPFAYWGIISLPLVFFMIQFQPMLPSLFAEFVRTDPTFFGQFVTLIFSWSEAIGGILFGIAFFLMARKTSDNNVIKNYAVISAFGYTLLFVSNQAGVLISATFPPFGLFAISFTGLASYLLLVGIYSSAIAMSEDSNLRKMIRKSVLRESNLLDILGIPEREEKLARRIGMIAKEHAKEMSDETGVKFLKEDDVKQYLDEVLKEIKAKKAVD